MECLARDRLLAGMASGGHDGLVEEGERFAKRWGRKHGSEAEKELRGYLRSEYVKLREQHLGETEIMAEKVKCNMASMKKLADSLE